MLRRRHDRAGARSYFRGVNTLGAGFLEKVYQRALLHELRLRGIRAAAESLISSNLLDGIVKERLRVQVDLPRQTLFIQSPLTLQEMVD
ncbi:MAG: hypothetical protein FJW37_06180, partial [Acidobacteria bacterium]|nr:hypothetical protein [Acidobacteriota bacterium]